MKIAMETLQTDVDNVEEQVGETNVVEIQENVTQLTTVVEQKADKDTVETLETELKTYVDEQIKNVEVTNNDYGEI